MKRYPFPVNRLVAAIVLLVLAGLAATGCTARSAGSTLAAGSGGTHPVLVELFTSEGCSDCPPADALLAQLARTQPVAGADIIPIEEHVDYFNSKAWADPFSSHAYTERQDRYRAAYSDSDVYTPEMIIQGGHGFIGSDRGQALAGIRDAAAQSSAHITIGSQREAGNKLDVTVATDTTDISNAVVVLALTQNNVSSDVLGGENAGHRLVHTGVARYMAPIGQISGPGHKSFSQTIPLDPKWPAANLRLVAFVQDPASMKVLGVATAPVT